jgi:hypothetical protein
MQLDSEIRPQVSRRYCGGWLALSPEGESLKIGTTGQTEADAVESFRQMFAACKNELERARGR